MGGVGGPQPSNSCSGADDMCVSSGSLVQQGFLAGFSGRAPWAQEKPVSSEKIAQRAFSTACRQEEKSSCLQAFRV